MIIQIDGINTQNKGAELMLVSVLEELENSFPGATIYINPDSNYESKLLPKYNLKLVKRPGIDSGKLISKIFSKFKIPIPYYFRQNFSPKNVDLILDASGFKYSDQWDRSKQWLDSKDRYYGKAKRNETKIVFLTQAFGPFETENGKRSVSILSKYCDLIYAREEVSYKYLLDAGADKNKVKKSCDFTLRVKGQLPPNYEHLRNKIAIIPNYKMITHGGNHSNIYIDFLLNSIKYFRSIGEEVFLLNHEGKKDFSLCKLINDKLELPCEIVTDLAAKEVKGVIGIAKLVISSRFHGVASALSQGVPCLATSWNHKYEMLFRDFDQKDNLLDANADWNLNRTKIDFVLKNLDDIRNQLFQSKPPLILQIDKMWKSVNSLSN